MPARGRRCTAKSLPFSLERGFSGGLRDMAPFTAVAGVFDTGMMDFECIRAYRRRRDEPVFGVGTVGAGPGERRSSSARFPGGCSSAGSSPGMPAIARAYSCAAG